MVSEQCKFVTIEVLVKLAYSKDCRQRLPLNLGVVLFCHAERSGSIGDGFFLAIRHNVQEYSRMGVRVWCHRRGRGVVLIAYLKSATS